MFKQATILNSYVRVPSLECGALAHGGATQVNGITYSNISTGEPIALGDINSYGIIIPSTMDIDQQVDSSEYVERYTKKLQLIASNVETIPAKGSWYSDELDRVVVEDNTILAFTSSHDPRSIMNFLGTLAGRIKDEMRQEAVSILVNEGLVIV